MKKFKLIASTLPELTYEKVSFDPLNMNYYTEEFETMAEDESEAISKFQETTIFWQFCDEHKRPFIHIKGEKDAVYRSIE